MKLTKKRVRNIAFVAYTIALTFTFMMGELGETKMAIFDFAVCLLIFPWIVANDD